MLVKILKDGVLSDWIQIKRERDWDVFREIPDAVVIPIEELYSDSPEAGECVHLDFMVFNAIAREFELDEQRQTKQKARYIDDRPIEEVSCREYREQALSVEEEQERRELQIRIAEAKTSMTEAQRRRLELYVDDGLSLREIAQKEGVGHTAVEDSVRGALKKIKNFLK